MHNVTQIARRVHPRVRGGAGHEVAAQVAAHAVHPRVRGGA